MLTIIKVFIITTLPVRKPWNFLKQISKVSFEVSNQEYSREGGGGCKNGGCIVRLHTPFHEHVIVIEDVKVCCFVECQIILPLFMAY